MKTTLLALVALSLAAVSVPALACSCWGTVDIGTAMTEADIVVVGRVERRLDDEPPDYANPSASNQSNAVMVDAYYPNPVAVTVIKTLKGDAAGEIRITTEFMCYRSFDIDDFKPGDTFVFPIFVEAESGLNVLPSCSHSAAKLVDGKLFTNEFVMGGGRRLVPYMSLTAVRVLLPLGLLHRFGQYVFAGFLVVLIPMLITHRLRKRVAHVPIDSPRSMNLRTMFAIAWMLVCGGFCLFLAWLDIGLLTLAVGASLAVAFSLAAAGLAFRWRWTEGFSYGLAAMWIGVCVAIAWTSLARHFEVFARLDEQMIVFLAIVGVTSMGMLWCADTVRRWFSPSRGAA